MEILHWVLIGLSVPLIVMMVVQTRKRAKALDERIEEYREEQEAAAANPGPVNPYDGLAAIAELNKQQTGQDRRR